MLLSVVIVLALMLSGCSDAAAPANNTGNESAAHEDTGSDEAPALKLTGLVDSEMAWAEEDVRAMETMEALYTNRDGEETAYTGVLLNVLLDEAGVQDGAASVVFVADDGYEAEVTLEEIQGCADCIVAFRDEGGFSTVLPGFPGNVQVKGVIEIKVQ